jgi:hypothetical protein
MFFDINTVGDCPILYYTVLYYPLPAPVNPIPTQVTLTPTVNNIHTITGVNTNIQQYNIYFNATNGNGTSNDSNVVTTKILPILSFTSFNTTGTWGSPYTLIQATITTPTPPPPGVTITYTSTNTSVATISGTTVTIVTPGTFSVVATTNETSIYASATVTSPNVAISNTAEVIIYNNPKVFPRNPGVSGEVGFIVGIPGGTWPSGYSNFTSVSITNGGVTVTYSSATTPTYNTCLNKYLVYGEPGTASSFIGNLSTGTASNIAFVGTSSLANGASSGVSLQFVFSGGFSTAPSTFTLNVDTGLINIAQGILYSKYPSITTSTIPPPNGSGSGSFIIGWKGYGGSWIPSNPSTVQQAWGISSNSASPPNPTESPLISSGTPPNHIFYPQTNQTTVSYYYYIGIPKMIAPNY